MVYKVFDKRSSGGGNKNDNMSSQEYLKKYTNNLSENLKSKKYTHPFLSNIWGADLANMQLRNKFKKAICFYYVLLMYRLYVGYILIIHRFFF